MPTMSNSPLQDTETAVLTTNAGSDQLSPLPFPLELVGLLGCLRRCLSLRLLLRLHRALQFFRLPVNLLRVLFPPADTGTTLGEH